MKKLALFGLFLALITFLVVIRLPSGAREQFALHGALSEAMATEVTQEIVLEKKCTTAPERIRKLGYPCLSRITIKGEEQ
jgi:hypothetical protein